MAPTNVEMIERGKTRYAIIIKAAHADSGVKFFTPDDAPLQVGAFRLAAGHVIEPHLHPVCERKLTSTPEVLVVQSGRLLVNFYDEAQNPLEERILEAGDVIVLLEGGHGFRVLEDLRMLEIKQGPYVGMADKTRFQAPPKSLT
jgi:hypothetical protein